jgi:hypothetical protein
MSNVTTFTLKITTLYVAYAPDFDVAAYGGCQDEALNNLTEELRQRPARVKEFETLLQRI